MAKKRKPKICKVPGCTKPCGKKLTMCCRHNSLAWRKKNPIRYTFNAIKNNAKRRRKPFSITYYDFMELIEHTAYMTCKGRRSYELHIDRIEEELGYIPGNLRVTTHSDNQDKYIIHLKKKSNDPF